MNILVINHYAGGPSLGMEYRQYYLIKEWQRLGNNILVITASYTHLRFKQIDTNSKTFKTVIDDVDYLVFKTPAYENNNYKRILNIISFLYSLKKNWKKIAKEFYPDVVIASSTYVFDIYFAKKIASFSKALLVFEVHDLWPLSPKEMGGFSKYHPFIYFMQKAEDFAYKCSDKVVSILPNTEKYMLEHGLQPGKFVHIPNGIFVDDWNSSLELPNEFSEIINNLKLKGNKIIAYAGNHGTANALFSLVDAMKHLQKENVVLVMIGNGQEKQNLIKYSKLNNLQNVIFLPAMSKTYIPALLDKVDILYIGIQNQPVFRFGISPNKLFDYMMAGKPIIQAIKASNDLVKETNCGITIEPENSNEIVKAVNLLLSKSEFELKRMGMNGREYCLKNHDYKILAKKFLDAFI